MLLRSSQEKESECKCATVVLVSTATWILLQPTISHLFFRWSYNRHIHCPAVSRRLYNSTGPRRIDPTMDSKHTENLKIFATTHSCSKEGVGCEPKLILFSIVPERNPQPSSHPSI
ncbi:hypothetical protein ES288_D04G041200v1 [Gossypium darwinii]|uniref:Uncharacterized protein n=1 Tax=Gossypium darwinii TaxID=34276 RepID=A0A5D2CSY4_GOSDA|nr:hypothetical protein ES288_D04G041200v1 [Gossypium darwinii]